MVLEFERGRLKVPALNDADDDGEMMGELHMVMTVCFRELPTNEEIPKIRCTCPREHTCVYQLTMFVVIGQHPKALSLAAS